MKTHDKEFFYKYTTADTAKKILQNLNVRWSSPVLFNDPFDTQIDLSMGFSFDDISQPLAERFNKLIFSEDEPTIDNSALGHIIVKKLRPLRKKLPEDKWKEIFEQSLEKGATSAREALESAQKDWKSYLSTFKVFCVAEEYDNLLMWSHYAEHHSGVVFKFKCIPSLDTALCAATPINYQTDMPNFGSLDEWVEHLTGLKRINMQEKSKEFIYTKSTDWSYEKEWRVYTIREEENHQTYVDLEILPEEINSLYLGCNINDVNKKEILSLLQAENLKHVDVHQAKQSDIKFKLEFENIKK